MSDVHTCLMLYLCLLIIFKTTALKTWKIKSDGGCEHTTFRISTSKVISLQMYATAAAVCKADDIIPLNCVLIDYLELSVVRNCELNIINLQTF